MLIVTYFKVVIHLSALSKTYIDLYFLKYCDIVGNLACINFMCDDASMASCDKRC